MKLTALHARLRELEMPYFRSRDAAAWLGVSDSDVSRVLTDLAETGHVIKLARGRWAHPERMKPFMLPQALVAPRPAYVSLYSALHHHGMIEQIPDVVYGVTTLRAHRVSTPIGGASLHHVAPSFFFGYESVEYGVNLATAEKALLDVLYLSPGRSRLFAALPELELPRGFKVTRAREMVQRVTPRSRQTIVAQRLEGLLRERG